MARSRIEINTYLIHTTLHNHIKRVLQLGLIYVMLILANPNTLRIYLHQLGQRIHQPATNRHRTAYRHILIRKLFARYF